MKIIVPSMIVPDLEKTTESEPRIDFDSTQKLFEHIVNGLTVGLEDYKDKVDIGFLLLSATTQGHRYGPEVIPELVKRVRQVDRDTYIAVAAWETEDHEVRPYIQQAAENDIDVFLPGSLKEEKPLENYVRNATQGFLKDTNLILYENPGLTGLSFDIGTIQRLKDECIIMGIKDSNPGPKHFDEVLKVDDLIKFLGAEELINIFFTALYKEQFQGIVPSTANACPEFIGEMVRYYLGGNFGSLEQDIGDLRTEIHPRLHGKDYKRKYGGLLYLAAMNGCGPDPAVIQEKFRLDSVAIKELNALCGPS